MAIDLKGGFSFEVCAFEDDDKSLMNSPFGGQFMLKLKLFKDGLSGTYTSFHVGLVTSPTGNCQLSSIMYMDSFLEFLSHTLQGNNPQEHITKVFTEIYKFLGDDIPKKKLFFIDIKKYLLEKLHTFFEIIIETPYVSTNNSNMVACIVKINHPE